MAECASLITVEYGEAPARECARAFAEDVSASGKALELIPVLAAMVADGRIPESVCHSTLHDLGGFEARRASLDLERAVLAAPASPCNSGFVHGALIAWGKGLPEGDGVESAVRLCGSLRAAPPPPGAGAPSPRGQTAFFDCSDGLGHALWHVSGGDVTTAVDLCSSLGIPDSQVLCILGVAMESAQPSPFAGPPPVSRGVVDSELIPWCLPRDPAYRKGCAGFASIAYMADLETRLLAQGDPPTKDELLGLVKSVFESCEGLPDSDLVSHCVSEASSRLNGVLGGSASWVCGLAGASVSAICEARLAEQGS